MLDKTDIIALVLSKSKQSSYIYTENVEKERTLPYLKKTYNQFRERGDEGSNCYLQIVRVTKF